VGDVCLGEPIPLEGHCVICGKYVYAYSTFLWFGEREEGDVIVFNSQNGVYIPKSPDSKVPDVLVCLRHVFEANGDLEILWDILKEKLKNLKK